MSPFGFMINPDAEDGDSWTPFDESGMIAWWNSANTSLDMSNNVISFLDISGNGVALPAASTPQRAAINFGDSDFGGNPSVTWSNADDNLYLSDIFAIGAYTLVTVVLNTTSINAYLMSLSAGDYTFGNIGLSLYTQIRNGTGASGYNANAGAGWLIDPAPAIWVRRMDGTHAGDTIWKNGVPVAMTDAFFLDDPGTGTINVQYSPMNYFSGGISAAMDGKWVTSLFYDHAVSDGVVAQIQTYFATLYSI